MGRENGGRPRGAVLRRGTGTVAEVAWVRALTPRMTRVRLSGEHLRGLRAIPGQTVKIYVPDPAGEMVSRDYTVRDVHPGSGDTGGDPESGQAMAGDADTPWLDIDFVLHGHGPAADWARRAEPGDQLEFVGPSGRYRPDPDAAWHLFAGDETALPAIQAYAAMLPPDAHVLAYLEVADPSEQQPVPGPQRSELHWLHRDGSPAGTTTLLEDALRAATLPSGPGRIWIAGHTPTVRRIRAHLLDERGVDRKAMYVKGFWDRAVR